MDGNAQDAVNPLSYAILESCGRLRSTQPNLSVRYHAGMSNDFLDACVQVIRCGFGMPAFNNDEIVIPEFIKLGIEAAGRVRLCRYRLHRNRRRR
ncbi:pyruvate formate-lyase [Klebsiella michiganensis]|nr:pyruvate formate-lyase [Klebsiella michiganensis]